MGNIKLLELKYVPKTIVDYSKYSDKDLLDLCQKYGTQAILWKRKFIGLLPEVDRRKLYEKKKCVSIYEFAAKFGGVTKKHTQRVIQIDKAFEEKGVKILRGMLQEGTASISKLVKVVSVVTVENESDIVTAVRNLSHESLETYVRDMRHIEAKRTLERERRCFDGNDDRGNLLSDGLYDENLGVLNGEVQIQNGLFEPSDCPKSVRPNTFEKGNGAGEESGKKNEIEMQNQNVALQKLQLDLSAETLEELLELQGKGIDVDALLREFLRKRKGGIAIKKETHGEKVLKRELKRKDAGKPLSRNISTVTKQTHTARSLPCEVRWRSQPLLKEEFGTKCAVNGCNKAAEHLHHTVPFSVNGSNSPDLLRPLCRAHHDIVHSVNERYLEKKGMG